MDNVTAGHLKQLQDLIDIQATDGNWNYDPYMHGMLIGMLVAKSILDGGDAVASFRDAPDIWLHDLKIIEQFNIDGLDLSEFQKSEPGLAEGN